MWDLFREAEAICGSGSGTGRNPASSASLLSGVVRSETIPRVDARGDRVTTEGAGRRLSVITLDQIMSGLSNLGVALLSAHLLGVEAFGYFGLLLVIVAAAMGVSRSLVGDPVMVHPQDARERPGQPVAGVLMIALGLSGVLVVLAGVLHLVDLPLAPELLVLAAGLPGLLIHDLGRYLGFATQRPMRSLILDTVWLVLLIAAMVAVIVTDRTTLTWFLLAWVGTGTAAALLVFTQHGPPTRGGFTWLRERWPYSWRFLLSFTALQGISMAFMIVVAAMAGARALGAVRGVLILIRPYMTFQTAAVAAGVSEVSNEQELAAARRHRRRTSTVALVVGLANIAFLLLMPDVIGRAILSDTWYAAKELLAPACLQILCLALIVGPRSYLTGRKAITTTVRIDIIGTVLIFAIGIVGAVWNGALGACWGVATGNAVAAGIWWMALRRHASRDSLRPTPTPAPIA